MRTVMIAVLISSSTMELLMAAEAKTYVHVDPVTGRIDGGASGTGDEVCGSCNIKKQCGMCTTIAIDRNGNAAYSSSLLIRSGGRLRTSTYNAASDSQGNSSASRAGATMAGSKLTGGASGSALADSKTTRTTSNASVSHLAPTREGRRNYSKSRQTPLPMAPAGYFGRYR